MDSDTFGGFSESFYLAGPTKTLTRNLYLIGQIDLPAATAFNSTGQVSQLNLGNMYAAGIGTKKNLRLAMTLTCASYNDDE